MNSPSWLSEGDNTSYERLSSVRREKKWFLAHCVYHWVFILSVVSLCSSVLHSKQDKHVFRNLEEWKKTLPPAQFKVSIIASDLSAGKILLTVSECSVSTGNMSLLPWCDVFKCAALCECPGGGTRAAPRQFRASTWGFSFFFFFFPWQTVNSHLRFVTRCHRPDQSLTGFQRVALCVIRGCK